MGDQLLFELKEMLDGANISQQDPICQQALINVRSALNKLSSVFLSPQHKQFFSCDHAKRLFQGLSVTLKTTIEHLEQPIRAVEKEMQGIQVFSREELKKIHTHRSKQELKELLERMLEKIGVMSAINTSVFASPLVGVLLNK
jgi:hypothetical protein